MSAAVAVVATLTLADTRRGAQPVKLIIDTDIGGGGCNDVDDVVAVCIANALTDNGEVIPPGSHHSVHCAPHLHHNTLPDGPGLAQNARLDATNNSCACSICVHLCATGSVRSVELVWLHPLLLALNPTAKRTV
jgi:hypothetical protein